MNTASDQQLTAVLPIKDATLLVKGKQTTKVHFGRKSFEVTCPVIGSDIDLTAGDYRVAIGLAAKMREPANVLCR